MNYTIVVVTMVTLANSFKTMNNTVCVNNTLKHALYTWCEVVCCCVDLLS